MSRPIIHTDILLKLMRSGSLTRAEKLLDRIHPADLARILVDLRPAEARSLLDLLFSAHRCGKTLSELPQEVKPQFLAMLDDRRLAEILVRVPPDDGLLFLEALDEERRERVFALVKPVRRGELERLLKYPPETAGSVMTPLFVALRRDQTAQQAIDAVRTRGEQVEAIFYLYVVDDSERLIGVVPIRKLVTSPPDRTLDALMLADPVAVQATALQEEVAQVVARYNLLAVPVVEEDRKLVGVITVDDVIDVIQEEATQDMYRLAGLADQDRVFSSWGTSVRKRLPWMSFNLLTASMAAAVVTLFEGTIAQKVVLASFMPVVAGMGGNMGTQTLTVITRSIALGEFELEKAVRVVLKNMAIGATIGAVTGGVLSLVAWLTKGDARLGFVLFLAMVSNLSVAGLMGSMVPVLLKKFNQDPALGGSVLLTAVTDSCGFMLFLGLAKFVFGL